MKVSEEGKIVSVTNVEKNEDEEHAAVEDTSGEEENEDIEEITEEEALTDYETTEGSDSE